MAIGNVRVSLDPAVIDMARAQARAAGMSTSAWIAYTIRTATIAEAARRYDAFNQVARDRAVMAAWDRTHRAGRRLAGAEW